MVFNTQRSALEACAQVTHTALEALRFSKRLRRSLPEFALKGLFPPPLPAPPPPPPQSSFLFTAKLKVRHKGFLLRLASPSPTSLPEWYLSYI